MIDPLTFLIAAGNVMKAGGEILSGFERSRAGRIQARIMESNAALEAKNAEMQRIAAEGALATGAFEEGQLRRQADTTIAGQTAFYAGAGLDPTIGSPLLLAGMTAAQAEIDAEIIRSRAATERAQGLATAATLQMRSAAGLAQANETRREARMAPLLGIARGVGTLLSSGGSWPGFGGSTTAAPVPGSGGAPMVLPGARLHGGW